MDFPWKKVFSTTRLIKKLKNEGFFIVALEQNKKSVNILKFKGLARKKPTVLLIGNEVSGIPPKILKQCDKILEIPMKGKKESLNVAVAFGIAAFILTNLH